MLCDGFGHFEMSLLHVWLASNGQLEVLVLTRYLRCRLLLCHSTVLLDLVKDLLCHGVDVWLLRRASQDIIRLPHLCGCHDITWRLVELAVRLRLHAVAELAETGQLGLGCGVRMQRILQLFGAVCLRCLLLLGLLPSLLSFLLVVALYRLKQVLDQGLLHRLTKLESLAEVASQLADVVAHVDPNPACLRRSHVHVNVEQQLLLLRLLETWWPHLSQAQPVVVFAPGPLL